MQNLLREPDFQKATFAHVRSPDQDAATPVHHPVIVVGAGPVGLAAAIDLAQQGLPVVLLDDGSGLSQGSRAICFAKRTLEIFDRLGCGQRMVDKGVSWNVGKVFFQEAQVYAFDLLAETGHRRPAFVNLQQYYVEGYLLQRALQLPNIDIRWHSKVIGASQDAEAATLSIETPEGGYALRCDYLLAADGARSSVRHLCGLESTGRMFRDRFLIADVKVEADFPAERWFWFDPPFHPNQSVLLHRQPDNVWRIDFQLGWDADPELEKRPENVIPRIHALLGADAQFTLEWVSVYTFSCLRMARFRQGRILFAGDAAHGVSPFGARGANSGVQDADNLAWKLKLVLAGSAPDALLDTYCEEREFAADENILHSTRSTDFITPKSAVSRVFRDATLRLSRRFAFARQLVNSGRLSQPAVLRDSSLNTPDVESFAGAMVPGAPVADAPVAIDGVAHWLGACLGDDFCALYFHDGADVAAAGSASASASEPASASLSAIPHPVDDSAIVPVQHPPALATLCALAPAGVTLRVLAVVPRALHAVQFAGVRVLIDVNGLLMQRFDGQPGTLYLIRPDQHVCARWRGIDADAVRAALGRAIGITLPDAPPESSPCQQ